MSIGESKLSYNYIILYEDMETIMWKINKSQAMPKVKLRSIKKR